MSKNEFAFENARIKANETKLLTGDDILFLAKTESLNKAFLFLKEKGWDIADENATCEDVIKLQEESLWKFLHELIKDEETLSIFTIQNDFYNLKVILKSYITKTDPKRLFVYPTSLDLDSIILNVTNHEFEKIDAKYHFKEAYDACVKSDNGQMCDIIFDAACLNCFYSLTQSSDSKLISEYGELFTALLDIKIAFRLNQTKKPLSLSKRALVTCKAFDSEELSKMTQKSTDELIEFLKKSDFKEAVDLICEDSTEFEKWFDDKMIEIIKQTRYTFFGFDPIFAFFFAKEMELKNVRIVLYAKMNNLDNEQILKRVRSSYV